MLEMASLALYKHTYTTTTWTHSWKITFSAIVWRGLGYIRWHIKIILVFLEIFERENLKQDWTLYIWYMDRWDLGKWALTFTFCFIYLSITGIFSLSMLFYNKNDPYFMYIICQCLIDHLLQSVAVSYSLHLMLSPSKHEYGIFTLLLLFLPHSLLR